MTICSHCPVWCALAEQQSLSSFSRAGMQHCLLPPSTGRAPTPYFQKLSVSPPLIDYPERWCAAGPRPSWSPRARVAACATGTSSSLTSGGPPPSASSSSASTSWAHLHRLRRPRRPPCRLPRHRTPRPLAPRPLAPRPLAPRPLAPQRRHPQPHRGPQPPRPRRRRGLHWPTPPWAAPPPRSARSSRLATSWTWRPAWGPALTSPAASGASQRCALSNLTPRRRHRRRCRHRRRRRRRRA